MSEEDISEINMSEEDISEINMSEEDISEINIIYKINKRKTIKKISVNIFGKKFVENNKNICKMIIDNNEYKISTKYEVKNYNSNKLKIILKGINNITDMSYMFYDCSCLSSLPDISIWDTSDVNNMSYMFYNCSFLRSFSDISKWDTSNVTNMSHMFYNCSFLR